MLDAAIIYWSLFSSCVVVIFNGVCLYTKVQISLREHKVGRLVILSKTLEEPTWAGPAFDYPPVKPQGRKIPVSFI